MADLYVRAGYNDHTVVDHFLTPKSVSLFDTREPTISAVVADATTALQRPQLADFARNSGTPFVIDPLTPLLQSEQPEDDSWASLSFAHSEPLRIADLNAYVLDELIDRTITFQREHGATELIPPYFFSSKIRDGWSQASIAALRRTADYLARHNIDLPVLPVFAASLSQYAPGPAWSEGLNPFIRASKELNAPHIALSWSWNNAKRSNEAALALLLGATEHASKSHHVIAWRAGAFGFAQTAAGADGYETGIGVGESLHYVTLAGQHRPHSRPNSGPRGNAYVYLDQFGRSVRRVPARLLLEHKATAGSFVCRPESYCCPGGAHDMVHRWREHTIRERRRQLTELDAIPPRATWRLHHVEQWADRAATLAHRANQVLEQAALPTRVPVTTFEGLRNVTGEMRVAHRSSAAS